MKKVPEPIDSTLKEPNYYNLMKSEIFKIHDSTQAPEYYQQNVVNKKTFFFNFMHLIFNIELRVLNEEVFFPLDLQNKTPEQMIKTIKTIYKRAFYNH